MGLQTGRGYLLCREELLIGRMGLTASTKTDGLTSCGFQQLDPTIQWTNSFDDTTTAESQVNNVINAGTIMVTGWHSANEGTLYTWADWKTHIDNVAAKRDAGSLDIVTMADLLGTGV